jgi:hypothetical protein
MNVGSLPIPLPAGRSGQAVPPGLILLASDILGRARATAQLAVTMQYQVALGPLGYSDARRTAPPDLPADDTARLGASRLETA